MIEFAVLTVQQIFIGTLNFMSILISANMGGLKEY